MDLSIILPIIAIVVSAITSAIALLLTQFQGPDISLISSPEFEITDDNMDANLKYGLRMKVFPPAYLDTKPTSFVFANHGGKSGTILSITFDFTPTEELKKFFNTFSMNFTLPGEQLSGSPTPVTIEAGDNKTLVAQLGLYFIDWKRTALAEVLNPTSKVDDSITIALLRSRDNFESYCELLSNSKKLGSMSFKISFTKGRFNTKVVTEYLLKNKPLQNRLDDSLSIMKEFLKIWEDLEPKRTQLLNETKGDLEGISQELRDNLNILNRDATEQSIASSRLKVDFWKQLCNVNEPCREKIRWFMIRSDTGLEEELNKLYHDFDNYNSLIDSVFSRGELGKMKRLSVVNDERKRLNMKVTTVLGSLSELYLRYLY
jgi:hypothetical protein